jgi:hypothetical protein
MRNLRASSSRVAVWKVARLEKEDKTSEDKPRRERGTESERVGYAGKDREARCVSHDSRSPEGEY